MPLQTGSSQKTFSKNISELMHSYKKKGSIGRSKNITPEKARKMALAIAFDKKRESQ